MNREPFETMPDVMDVKQIAQALHLSKAGVYNLLNNPDFPTLIIGGRKLVMKQDLIQWLKSKTNRHAAGGITDKAPQILLLCNRGRGFAERFHNKITIYTIRSWRIIK